MTAADRQTTLPAWPVAIFLVSLTIPWIIPVGPLAMSVNRLVLVTMTIPCLVMWVSGRAGPIRVPDIAILLFCFWGTISFMKAHGISPMIESGGILFIETMGAYLLARCYIRNAEDFRKSMIVVAMIVAALFPFALYEWLTGGKPILTMFAAIFPTIEVTMGDNRLGLWRVQGPFAHPILFGLFCASIFAIVLSIGRHSRSFRQRLLAYIAAMTALVSMSSAPVAAIAIQGALLGWDQMLRQYQFRWKLLWVLAFAAWLVVEFGSNQPPIQFYISHFTFNQGTGWYRLYIWEYGLASVLNHPLWGIGFADWVRPAWMYSGSIDNFWLVIAVRHGIPAFLFMAGACLWMAFTVAVKKTADQKYQIYRTGYLISLVACMFVATTVHFWTTSYVWFMFLLGSGSWILDVSDQQKTGVERDRTSRRAMSSRRICATVTTAS